MITRMEPLKDLQLNGRDAPLKIPLLPTEEDTAITKRLYEAEKEGGGRAERYWASTLGWRRQSAHLSEEEKRGEWEELQCSAQPRGSTPPDRPNKPYRRDDWLRRASCDASSFPGRKHLSTPEMNVTLTPLAPYITLCFHIWCVRSTFFLDDAKLLPSELITYDTFKERI